MYTKVLLTGLALSLLILSVCKEEEKEIYIPAVSYEIKEEALFSAPLKNGEVTSHFGKRDEKIHEGLDIAVPVATPIFASCNGVVRFCGELDGYGLTVVLSHDNGYMTLYAHCNSFNVMKNQPVLEGEIIAYSGNSGTSTGPHLHFEIRKDEIPLNPENFIII